MTDKKCPKCGSRTYQIVEYAVQELIYEVTDGYVEAYGEGDGGDHIKTTCHCKVCNHFWHPRKFDYTIDE